MGRLCYRIIIVAHSFWRVITGHPLQSLSGSESLQEEPCELVRLHVEKWRAENDIVVPDIDPESLERIIEVISPSVPPTPMAPSLAYACLKTIPFHKEEAIGHLHFLKPAFEWQSTLDYLTDPLPGYLSEGVDLLRGLDDIEGRMEDDAAYENMWDFLDDLHTLTSTRVKDFHFQVRMSLYSLFKFAWGVQLVSVSEDCRKLPDIFLWDDVAHTNANYRPSPVAAIDGIPAGDFVKKASLQIQVHDPDARYNTLFRTLASDLAFSRRWAQPFTGPSLQDVTKVTLQNGTELEYENTAYLGANFSMVSSGKDLYDAYGDPTSNVSLPSDWEIYELQRLNWTIDFTGYPEKVEVVSKSQAITGFLPTQEQLKDVAVISVNQFVENIHVTVENVEEFSSGADTQIWADAVTTIVQRAKDNGRSKLLIDLQGNSGGLLTNLQTLYTGLFPKEPALPVLWAARAHPQLAWIGSYLDAHREDGQSPLEVMGLDQFDKPDGTAWASFQEFYGPVPGRRGASTHGGLVNATRGTDYSFSPPWASPPFPPENIVLVTDGYCGSACAIFVDILANTHGVRTVAMGGRPMEAPMQAVGATKGGPVADFWGIPTDEEVDRSAAPPGVVIPPDPVTGRPPLRMGSMYGWAGGMSVNLMNLSPVEEGDGAVPAQMRYEAANCKLFFTWEMMRDITVLWREVVDVTWGEGRCVAGSTTNDDGTMGWTAPGYTAAVEDEYKLGPGPGALV